jgi:hypothetical protein
MADQPPAGFGGNKRLLFRHAEIHVYTPRTGVTLIDIHRDNQAGSPSSPYRLGAPKLYEALSRQENAH